MTFKDIKLVEAENIIYIPQPMAWALEAFLKRDCPALECEIIPKWKIKYGLYGEADISHFLYLHKDLFADTEYEEFPMSEYVGLKSNIDTDYIVQKLKLFHGDEKDEEVKKWEKERESAFLIKKAPDSSDYAMLNLDSRIFSAVGSYEKMEELQRLMEEKDLDQDDIIIILKSLELNPIPNR